MLITYFRSSSYNNWDFCQAQYYLSYVLGLPQTSGKKANQGTLVHKVLEILAKCKKMMQDANLPPYETNPTPLRQYSFLDEHIGTVEWGDEEFLQPTELSNEEIDSINKTRISKSKYKHDAKIPYGAVHYGQEMVDKIFDRVYEYYSEEDWAPVDRKDCYNWSWMALEYKGGIFDPRKCEIVAAEPRFNFVIDKPWAKFDWNLPNGQNISGNLGIKGTIDLITAHPEGIIEIRDYKGLPVDTPIPTPDGWSTMGDLRVGDTVFDEDGKQTNVIGKSQVKTKPCYKITFDDTTEVICDNEHLWKMRSGVVCSVKKLCKRDKINITKPLDTKDVDLPIDPYVLGVWLGDGKKSGGEIFGIDQFIFNEIEDRGHKVGRDISGKASTCPSHTIFGLRTQLRLLNLLHNKHIPQTYLRASYKQRLDLLRGLMDSDGNVNKTRKQAVFTNCNKQLSTDTKELLLTLGQRPCLHHTVNKQFNRDIDVYPISFRPININPFLLPRKSDNIHKSWGPGRSNYRNIKKIETVKNQQTQCIMVDSPTSTYLCTKNMVPTHNTGQRLDWASSKNNDVKTYEKLCNDFQLRLYYYAAKRLYPDAKQIIVSIFWIRDGGVFTMCFDDNIEYVENKLRERFQEISTCEFPAMRDVNQRDFRCTKLCDYYKMVGPNGDNMCKYIHGQIEKKGIDYVTNTCTQDGFSVGFYQEPGEK